MVEKALQSKWHIDYVSIICIPDNRKIFMCKGSLEEDSKQRRSEKSEILKESYFRL